MRNNCWPETVSWDEVCRRNAGRRRYHRLRRLGQALRRRCVVHLLRRYGLVRGVQARIARELNVHRSTIGRDLAALFSMSQPGQRRRPEVSYMDMLQMLAAQRVAEHVQLARRQTENIGTVAAKVDEAEGEGTNDPDRGAEERP